MQPFFRLFVIYSRVIWLKHRISASFVADETLARSTSAATVIDFGVSDD
jgi:hypothetical protein